MSGIPATGGYFTVEFPLLGEAGTYPDGTTQEEVQADYHQRRFRKGWQANPVMATVGLVNDIVGKGTEPKRRSVDPGAVVGMAPEQTNALLDRNERAYEHDQQTYQQGIDREQRAQEAQTARAFAASQAAQQNVYQTQREDARNQREDTKEQERLHRGDLRDRGDGTYDRVYWGEDGTPQIERIGNPVTKYETVHTPRGGVVQFPMNAQTGQATGAPTTVVEPEPETVRYDVVYDQQGNAWHRNPENPQAPAIRVINEQGQQLSRGEQISNLMPYTDGAGNPYLVNRRGATMQPVQTPGGFTPKAPATGAVTAQQVEAAKAKLRSDMFPMGYKPTQQTEAMLDSLVLESIQASQAAAQQVNQGAAPAAANPASKPQGALPPSVVMNGKTYKLEGNQYVEVK